MTSVMISHNLRSLNTMRLFQNELLDKFFELAFQSD